LSVIKKLKQVKKTNPEINIDILLSHTALNSCHVDKDYLVEKLTKEGFSIHAEDCNRQVHIAQSASGDGHYEIGGGAHGRVSSVTATVSGISIH
jgi:hypothetical protein